MDEVINRLLRDKNFRNLLRRDPEQALSGYDLTPEEKLAFFKLKKRVSDEEVTNPAHHR